MGMRKTTFNAYCVAAAAVFASVSAQAQDYPARPVTLITPAAAGNSPDVVMRVVAENLGAPTANLIHEESTARHVE